MCRSYLTKSSVLSPRGKTVYWWTALLGRGGHARELLKRLGPNGRLIGFDQDPAAIEAAQDLAKTDKRFIAVHASFSDLRQEVYAQGFEAVNGVLFDLGVSSPQLDDASRGFSFQADGPLDMRMDSTKGVMAADWLAGVGEPRLIEVLKKYGEERYARRIAKAIVSHRSQQRIETTMQLADIVSRTVPTRERHKHPATRVFQAIRIALNDELGSLEKGLAHAVDVLAPGGRLAVISFHSLEDRQVKRFFRDCAKPDSGPFALPHPDVKPTLKIVAKPQRPGADEQQRNPRSRSAVLRVAEKCA